MDNVRLSLTEMICRIYEYVQLEHARSLVKKRLNHDEQAQGRCDVARLIESILNEYQDILTACGAENRITEFIESEQRRQGAA